jgi:hypothetical protein
MSMSRVRFELATPVFDRAKAVHALGRCVHSRDSYVGLVTAADCTGEELSSFRRRNESHIFSVQCNLADTYKFGSLFPSLKL